MTEPAHRDHHRHRRHRHRAPARSRDGRGARFGRASAAGLVALTGLAMITLGPAAIAIGWHTQNQIRIAQETTRNPIGTEVREGPATFVVHEVRCGADDDTVHGQRCTAEVTVRNDGAEELTVPGIAQVLQGPDGVRYLPVLADPEPFGTLEPGEDATATFRYDLPPHGRVTHVRVHSDVYSRGEAVTIGGPPLPLVPPTD
jgi:hypothetical protein